MPELNFAVYSREDVIILLLEIKLTDEVPYAACQVKSIY